MSFNSCNKDNELTENQGLNYRTDSVVYNLQGPVLEFYNFFKQQLPLQNFNDPNYSYIPFTFEIDWNSGMELEVYGNNSMAFNVLNNEIDNSLFVRNQVVFTKTGQNNFTAKTLTYVADSLFYTDLIIIPSLTNFTGLIFESDGGEQLVSKVYYLGFGKIIKTQIINSTENGISLRGDDCPPMGGRSRWWYNLWHCEQTITTNFHMWYEDNFGEFAWGDFGNPYIPWINGGNPGGGGYNPNIKNPWNDPKFLANSACVDANYRLLQSEFPEIFTQNYFPDYCNTGDFTDSNIRFALSIFCTRNENSINLSTEDDLNAFKALVLERQKKRILNALNSCEECKENFKDIEDKYCIKLPTEIKITALLGLQDCSNIYSIETLSLAYYANSSGFYDDLIKSSCDINNLIELLSFLDGFDIDDAVEENINECESKLIEKYKIEAIKIYFNRKKAVEMTKLKFGFNETNDCSDAFRHAYFNALNIKSVGRVLTDLFAHAHECLNPPDRNDVRMDIHNNYVGMSIVDHNYLPDDEIAEIICNKLTLGELEILEDPSNKNSQNIPSYGCYCN
jgi:hypothetical protein